MGRMEESCMRHRPPHARFRGVEIGVPGSTLDRVNSRSRAGRTHRTLQGLEGGAVRFRSRRNG